MQSRIKKSTSGRLLTMLLVLILLCAPAFGADSGSDSGPGPNPGQQSAVVAEASPAYNDYALLIAGMDNSQGTLAALEDESGWHRYASFISQSWQRFDRNHLAPMRQWASQELRPANSPTVFYPFSGPDFVNLYNLFPHARTYLMVALEPVGRIPDLAGTDENHFFAALKRSLYDLLQLNFFITEKLNNSLEEPELKGILPILLFFLAREQIRVLNVQYWVMKPEGTIAESPAAGAGAAGRQGIAGVRIDFASIGSEQNQTLYYFRFNLCNDSFQRHEKFVSFLKGFGRLATFIKAASYLMHRSAFSEIRNFILEQSDYVLQGDSAIPVKYFDRSAWDLKFFGTYSRPIDLFKEYRQEDLAEIYKEGTDVYPLPFGIDYRHRVKTSNLMFATKKVEAEARASK